MQIANNPDSPWWDFDLDRETLMERYVHRYRDGSPMPVFGQWVHPTYNVVVRIFATEEPIGQLDNVEKEQRMGDREVTREFITGPAGSGSSGDARTEPSRLGLQLPSLSIKGFRGISTLAIPNMGRVTLITGKNGVGKTTVLEAVRIYADRARYQILRTILRDREETIVAVDEDGDDVSAPNIETLFHRGNFGRDDSIIIGKTDDIHPLTIKSSPAWRQASFFHEEPPTNEAPILNITFGPYAHEVYVEDLLPPFRTRRRRRNETTAHLPPSIVCESSGPGIIDNSSMTSFWDDVVFTEREKRAVRALQLVYGREVEGVTMVADEDDRVRLRPRNSRKAVVKMKGQEGPVPLKSLGDGAVRLFTIALALANSRDGFLVIDEAENGIHHSMQADFWKMILRTAHDYNVQVIASTHGWDCVVGFAQATLETPDAEGILVRIENNGGDMRIIEYPEENLQMVATYGIEVR